jgi:hypothetical protein
VADLAATDAGVVEEASRLEREILDTCLRIRATWVELAGQLYTFHEDRCWEVLGYDTFEEWLASPDIDISRRHVFKLIEAYRELVIERGVSTDALGETEVTKVGTVLPAIRRGDVSTEDALADVKALSRTDLVERYKDPNASLDAESEPEWAVCEACGSRYKVGRTA